MTKPTSIRRAFELLEHAQKSDFRTQLRSVSSEADNQNAHFALEQGGGRALYVETGSSEQRGVEDKTAGYSLEVRDFDDFDSGVALMLRLTDDIFTDPFMALLSSFIEHSSDASDSVASHLRSTVERFRVAFKGRGDGTLSLEAQIGLIAELHLLHRLNESGLENIADAWHLGGSNARHDFSFEHCSIEVKGTLAREEFTLSVHGLDQLTPAPDQSLFLYAEQFEESPAGETLTEAVDTVMALFPVSLFEKLTSAGYAVADRDLYSRRFAVTRTKSKVVDDEMPRLAKSFLPDSMLAEHIKNVTYRVDFGPIPGDEDELAVSRIVEAIRR